MLRLPKWPKVSAPQCMAEESFAVSDRVVKGLLPVLGDWRGLVGAGRRQIAGRLEDEGVPLADVVGLEEPSVLGCHDLEAMFLADISQDALGVAELVSVPRDHRVLETGALREKKDLLAARLRPGERSSRGLDPQQGGATGQQPLTTIQFGRDHQNPLMSSLCRVVEPGSHCIPPFYPSRDGKETG